jgi:hypothetical protein
MHCISNYLVQGKLRILQGLQNQVVRALKSSRDSILDESFLCFVEFDKPVDLSLMYEIEKVQQYDKIALR